MPPVVDLAPLIASINAGFASVTAAISNGRAVDLTPLTEEIRRVADALYVEGEDESVANLMATANDQITSVIGPDSAGDPRVRVNTDMP